MSAVAAAQRRWTRYWRVCQLPPEVQTTPGERACPQPLPRLDWRCYRREQPLRTGALQLLCCCAAARSQPARRDRSATAWLRLVVTLERLAGAERRTRALSTSVGSDLSCCLERNRREEQLLKTVRAPLPARPRTNSRPLGRTARLRRHRRRRGGGPRGLMVSCCERAGLSRSAHAQRGMRALTVRTRSCIAQS